MKKLLRSYVTEFNSRNISSFKRIIKLLAIVCVPFLYAFFCVYSFWDPIGNIGNGTMVIVNHDEKELVFQAGMPTDSDYRIGIVCDENYQPIKVSSYNQSLSFEEQYMDSNYYLETFTSADTQASDTNSDDSGPYFTAFNSTAVNNFNSWQWLNTWDILKSLFIKVDSDKSDMESNWNLDFYQENQRYNFKNISYVDASEKPNFKSDKYNSVLTIQRQTIKQLVEIAAKLVYYQHNLLANKIDLTVALTDLTTALTNLNKIKFDAKYSNGFIYGYYLNSTLRFSTAISQTLLPAFISKNISTLFYNQLSYTPTQDQIVTSYDGATTQLNKNVSYVISDIQNKETNQLKTDGTTPTAADTAYGDVSKFIYDNNNPPTTSSLPGGKIYKYVTYLLSSASPANNQLLTALGIYNQSKDFTFIKNLALTADDYSNETISDLGVIINGMMYDISHGINFSNDETHGFFSQLLKKPLRFADIQSNFNLAYDISNQISRYLGQAGFYGNVYNGATPQAAVTRLDFQTSFDNVLTKLNFPSLSSFILDFANAIINKADYIIPIEIGGTSYAYYGLGIGLLFLVIGIYLGTFIQTFIYDRGKREKNTNAWEWYFSKTLLMVTTSILQATLALIGAIIGGWSILPIGILFALWGVVTLGAVVFAMVVQFVWFLARDEAIGRFIVVIILIVNLTASGGIFPRFMQFKFFDVLGNIAIFNYLVDIQRLLIFNISENGFNHAIAHQFYFDFVIIILIALIIGLAGIFVAWNLNRIILYGTKKAKIIQEAIEKFDLPYNFATTKNKVFQAKYENKLQQLTQIKSNYENKIAEMQTKNLQDLIIEKIVRKLNKCQNQITQVETKLNKISHHEGDKLVYNWNALPKIRDEKIYWYTINRLGEKQFNWYKQKYKEPTLKINYTEYDENENVINKEIN